MVMRKLEIQRILKKLNQKAWRVRILLSTTINRLRASGRSVLGPNRQNDPPETVAEAEANIETPINVPPRPILYPRDESTWTNVQEPTLLPVVQHDEPEQETFARFADFPAEIRLIVWQFACLTGRVIEVEWIARAAGFRLRAYPRPPVLLRVCQESRREALRLYRPYFRSKIMPGLSVLINPASDIIFFRQTEQTYTRGISSMWRHELGDVRRVGFVYRGNNNLRFVKKTACSFPNLEEVVILWGADASAKSTRARRPNSIEQTSFGTQRLASWWRDDIAAMLAAQGRWANLGRKPPAITVRHWCNGNASDL